VRRRSRLGPIERDARARSLERVAYTHFASEPEELSLDVRSESGSTTLRVMAFDRTAPGTPVLVLHGIASISVLIAPLLPALRGRPVYVVDWPGHGLSGQYVLAPQSSFRSASTHLVAQALDLLELERVDVVGHSLGGQIALYCALDLRERIRRLVLLGAPGAALAGTRPLPVMKLLAVPRLGVALLSAPLTASMFDRSNDMALGPRALDSQSAELIEAAYLIAGRAANARSIASHFRNLVRRGRVRTGVAIEPSELRHVTQPTLMAWGDSDVFLTPLQAASSIVSLTDVRLLTIPGAGHAPWLNDTESVGSAVTAHLGPAG
jgi:pimeloyl-ACP methyl ester carboxylesterase